MKKSRVGIIFGVLALMLVATGCSSLVDGKWAAKVNEEAILVKDYDARVSEAKIIYEQQGLDFNTDQGEQALSQIKTMLLDRMIDAKLIAQEVKKNSLNPEDAKVKEQEEIIKKSIGDEKKFQDTLKQQGMTEPELRSFLTVYEKITGDIKLSDPDIKSFYDKNIGMYSRPESVKARHILVETEDEANAIIAQLNTGINFVQLAKEKSIEPGAEDSGGDLGTFAKGDMVPEFETAAFSQKEGTFSKAPVKTEFGYHVILVEEHTPVVVPDYTEIKAQVSEDALNQAKDAKFQTYFDDLRNNAKIDYSQGYKPVS